MENFTRVAGTSDLADGEIMLVEVDDDRILLSNVEGEFYAIGEVCSHAEGPLSDGLVDGDEVECPWHASRFNLRTGESTSPPADEPVARYQVKIEGDDILVGLS